MSLLLLISVNGPRHTRVGVRQLLFELQRDVCRNTRCGLDSDVKKRDSFERYSAEVDSALEVESYDLACGGAQPFVRVFTSGN